MHSSSTFHRSSLTACSSACPLALVDVRSVCQTRRRHSSGVSQFHSATLSSTPGDWPTYYTSSRYSTLHRWPPCVHYINAVSICSCFCGLLSCHFYVYSELRFSQNLYKLCVNATSDVVERFISRPRWSLMQQAHSRAQQQHWTTIMLPLKT